MSHEWCSLSHAVSLQTVHACFAVSIRKWLIAQTGTVFTGSSVAQSSEQGPLNNLFISNIVGLNSLERVSEPHSKYHRSPDHRRNC